MEDESVKLSHPIGGRNILIERGTNARSDQSMVQVTISGVLR
jgi:hypothetical protein